MGEVDQREDLLVVDVGCLGSVPSPTNIHIHPMALLTEVLGLAGNLAEELDEVGQVIAEELCLEDEVLARVVGVEASSEKLGFADNAECRPSLGSLWCN